MADMEAFTDPLPSGLNPTRYEDTTTVASTCVKRRQMLKPSKITQLKANFFQNTAKKLHARDT
eukprot:1609616-Ditylum_brightwellii.AAC.1